MKTDNSRKSVLRDVLLLAVAGVAAWGLCGCRGSKAKPPATRPGAETRPAGAELAPKVPGMDDEQPDPGMEILVKNPRIGRTAGEGGYRRDLKVPSGRLVGACKWASPVINHRKVPPVKPVEFTGPMAIKDPVKGEREYYENLKLKPRRYFVNNYLGTYPTGVVLIVRGVKTGRRSMFPRGTFIVREGRFRPHIQFNPVAERVMFGTYDSYPTHVLMRGLAGEKVPLDKQVTAFDRGTIKPLGGGGVHYMARPKMLQSDVVAEMGGYEISCRRHAWKRAYVFFLDSPYGVVTYRGKFTVYQVPVGTWRVDVWHPRYKPVQESYEVQIKEDEVTELAVKFHPPEALKAKPAKPAK